MYYAVEYFMEEIIIRASFYQWNEMKWNGK